MALNVNPMYAYLYDVLKSSNKQNLQKATKSSATAISAEGFSMQSKLPGFEMKNDLSDQGEKSRNKSNKSNEEDIIEQRLRRLDLF